MIHLVYLRSNAVKNDEIVFVKVANDETTPDQITFHNQPSTWLEAERKCRQIGSTIKITTDLERLDDVLRWLQIKAIQDDIWVARLVVVVAFLRKKN